MPTGLREVKAGKKSGELSALLECRNPVVLQAHGFERAFWGVEDEGPVEEAIVLIGRERRGGWKTKRLEVRVRGDEGATEDAESLVRRDGWIYVLGSHFGAKDGPMEGARAFAARFREDDLEGKVHRAKALLDVARRPFRLHRAINDALREAGVELVPLGPHVRRRYIEKTLRDRYGEDDACDVRVEDAPINIEGAELDDDGGLLLGLRFPVAAQGHPLLVRLAEVDALFDPQPRLDVGLAGVLSEVGDRDRPVGVRGLQRVDGAMHVLTGPIGSIDKPNSVAMDYPGSQRAPCEHWRLERAWDVWRAAQRVRRFDAHRVEGMARAGGRWHYSLDTPKGLRLLVEGEDG